MSMPICASAQHRLMSSAGRGDTAATIHAAMAAVAGLSLAMVAPPGSHLAKSVNQDLGIH